MNADLLPAPEYPPDGSSELDVWDEPEDESVPDDVEMPCTDEVTPSGEEDKDRWESFVPDDDERDSQPEPGDFQSPSIVPVPHILAGKGR